MELAPSHIPTAKASGASAVTVQRVERWSCPTLHTATWKTPVELAFTTAAPEDHDGVMGFRSKNKSKCKSNGSK